MEYRNIRIKIGNVPNPALYHALAKKIYSLGVYPSHQDGTVFIVIGGRGHIYFGKDIIRFNDEEYIEDNIREVSPWEILANGDPEGWIENAGEMLCDPDMKIQYKYSTKGISYSNYAFKCDFAKVNTFKYWRPAHETQNEFLSSNMEPWTSENTLPCGVQLYSDSNSDVVGGLVEGGFNPGHSYPGNITIAEAYRYVNENMPFIAFPEGNQPHKEYTINGRDQDGNFITETVTLVTDTVKPTNPIAMLEALKQASKISTEHALRYSFQKEIDALKDKLAAKEEDVKKAKSCIANLIVGRNQIYEAWENLCVEHKEICGELDRRDRQIAALNEELEQLQSKGMTIHKANLKVFRF